MADKKKVKLKTNKETVGLNVVEAHVDLGGVLKITTEDENGTKTKRWLSPFTWEEIELQ